MERMRDKCIHFLADCERERKKLNIYVMPRDFSKNNFGMFEF